MQNFERAIIYADVAELADALDLGSSVARRECSSHFIRTKNAPKIKDSLVLGAFYFCFAC